MSVLDGFLSTWSKARETFGQGVPQGGTEYDGSRQLQDLQTKVASAAPGKHWTGNAASAYDSANADHRDVFGKLAVLDQRLAAQVNESARIVTLGRRNLDAVRRWVLDAAGAVPTGTNREQMLMTIVHKGLGQVSDIVTKSNSALADIGTNIRTIGNEYQGLSDQKFAPRLGAGDALGTLGKDGTEELPRSPITPGRPADPADIWVGDPRFGQWETVPLPPQGPYAPLVPEHRRLPDDAPLTIGPPTGMYVPQKTWVADDDAPYAQYQEGYRFRLAGAEATDVTRVVSVNGRPQVQRWVANEYEFQKNTSTGGGNDLSGLPPIQDIDHTWKPISLPDIAKLSTDNTSTTYYLPDGCGGSVKFLGGIPSGTLPSGPPVMTRPR